MPLRICVAAFLQRSSQSVKLEVVLKPLSFPPVYSHMFTALARCSVLLFLFLACVACKPKEEISTYTTERTSAPRPPFNKEEVASQLDHTLAAMLPVDKTVWFFKLAGPAEAVARHRDEFNRFLKTVEKGDSAESPLAWQVPDGWSEKGPSEMRLATIVVPDEKEDLEIAISSLPLSGPWDEYVALNVNRWLGQLSQGELSKQAILEQTSKIETATGPATVIELSGILKQTPAMNPHAGMTGGAKQAAPPKSAQAVAPPSANAGFTFETPEGWQPGKTSMMRKAAFNIGTGDKQAEVTVIPLPTSAGPQITEVQANAQRWASQVGLPPGTNLEEYIEKTEIDGNEGSFIRLESPAETNPQATMLVAMVEHGEKVWFFKIVGNSEIVDEQQDKFQEFLASVHFE